MVGPIYGHRDKQTSKSPIGIIQFQNKEGYKQINDQDKVPINNYKPLQKKFYAIQELLGLSIDNTSEVHSTINVTISVREAFGNIEKILSDILAEDREHYEIENNLDQKLEYIKEIMGTLNDTKKSFY